MPAGARVDHSLPCPTSKPSQYLHHTHPLPHCHPISPTPPLSPILPASEEIALPPGLATVRSNCCERYARACRLLTRHPRARIPTLLPALRPSSPTHSVWSPTPIPDGFFIVTPLGGTIARTSFRLPMISCAHIHRPMPCQKRSSRTTSASLFRSESPAGPDR